MVALADGKSRWVYRLADGIFVRGGFYAPTFDGQTEGVVAFSDADPHPDVVRDRFDAELGKRPATAEELAANGAVIFDAKALDAIMQNKPLAAVGLALYGMLLGHPPTPQEKATLFATIKAVYKSL